MGVGVGVGVGKDEGFVDVGSPGSSFSKQQFFNGEVWVRVGVRMRVLLM